MTDIGVTDAKKIKTRRSFSAQKAVFAVVLTVFALYAVTLIFPLLWLLMNSFRSKIEFFFEPLSFPKIWNVKNYITIFSEFNIFSMFINSILLSAGGTFAAVMSSSMAAYVVSKYKFKARNAIYVLAITLMIIPSTGSIAAQYRLMNDTGLAGTHIGMIILYAGGFGTNFFLLYGYFKSVSWSYAEAAQIDGAGNLQVFIRVMLPQALPALFSVGIISFIGCWNDYFAPFLYLKNFPTLAVGIQLLSEEITIGANASDYPALFAAMVISTVPIITLFAIFQKTIISNTVAGGLKG
jgi:raffinose/stachyose/melibiose transport system permease protein/N-acetylglucosamine transport system permease protein